MKASGLASGLNEPHYSSVDWSFNPPPVAPHASSQARTYAVIYLSRLTVVSTCAYFPVLLLVRAGTEKSRKTSASCQSLPPVTAIFPFFFFKFALQNPDDAQISLEETTAWPHCRHDLNRRRRQSASLRPSFQVKEADVSWWCVDVDVHASLLDYLTLGSLNKKRKKKICICMLLYGKAEFIVHFMCRKHD